MSVTGTGLPGVGGPSAAPAPTDSVLLAGFDPKFIRTFKGGIRGKKLPFSHQELALALARAQRGQQAVSPIKDPKSPLPETAVAEVPTE